LSSARKDSKKVIHAVNDVSFSIMKGETFGVVGESGCGKTVTGKMLLKLIDPTSGDVFLRGQNIVKMSHKKFRSMRREIQTVFQDPNCALDPKMTIETILAEPLLLHGIAGRPGEAKEVARLLDLVGLESSIGKVFPHELSSGQKQRIGIARAISTNPSFILCDEPVSALDVSVQSQILNLLSDLKRSMGVTYLFISHSLGVIHHVSDRVAVMYLGRVVELGTTGDVFENPLHPYTRALLDASPVPDPDRTVERMVLKGEVPSAVDIPDGCPFHPRCPFALEKCRKSMPENKRVSDSHTAACHLV
jgi:oligopeptide/dipeptide ABC transporter ATP-binding protein